jgi:hypothetical protein
MKFSQARNYRGDASPSTTKGPEAIGELSYLGLGELEALQAGDRVRVKRYGLLFPGEVVSLGPVPPVRDGRRVVRDLKNRTTPDLGARRVRVRLQMSGREREVEVRARDLIRAASGRGPAVRR